jgi:hypothetical protein
VRWIEKYAGSLAAANAAHVLLEEFSGGTEAPSRLLNEPPRTLADEWNLRMFVPHG